MYTSQYAIAKFEACGNTYRTPCPEAVGIVKGMSAVSNVASLVFTQVVIARSTVKDTPNCGYRHELAMWEDKGPLTAQQFLQMMQYPPQISNEDWYKYMEDALKV